MATLITAYREDHDTVVHKATLICRLKEECEQAYTAFITATLMTFIAILASMMFDTHVVQVFCISAALIAAAQVVYFKACEGLARRQLNKAQDTLPLVTYQVL